MSAAKHLLLGRGGSTAVICTGNSGFIDDDQIYNMLGQTDRVAPAGIDGEVAFFTLYVKLVYMKNHTLLRVTPIIDNVAQPVQNFDLLNADEAVQKHTVLEVRLTRQLPNTVTGYATRGEWVPRGTWFQATIETTFVAAGGFVRIEGIALEKETVLEGKMAGANPA